MDTVYSTFPSHSRRGATSMEIRSSTRLPTTMTRLSWSTPLRPYMNLASAFPILWNTPIEKGLLFSGGSYPHGIICSLFYTGSPPGTTFPGRNLQIGHLFVLFKVLYCVRCKKHPKEVLYHGKETVQGGVQAAAGPDDQLHLHPQGDLPPGDHLQRQ